MDPDLEFLVQQALAFLEQRKHEHEERIKTDPEYAANQTLQHQMAADMEAHQRIRRNRHRMQALGIPRLYASLLLQPHLKPTPALRAVQTWRQHPEKRILVLSGPPCIGKSLAAAWALSQGPVEPYEGVNTGVCEGVWPEQLQGQWVDVWALVRASPYTEEPMLRWETCSLLVLDDLGLESIPPQGRWLPKLERLFRARQKQDARTLVTTSLTPPQLEDRYGSALFSYLSSCRSTMASLPTTKP